MVKLNSITLEITSHSRGPHISQLLYNPEIEIDFYCTVLHCTVLYCTVYLCEVLAGVAVPPLPGVPGVEGGAGGGLPGQTGRGVQGRGRGDQVQDVGVAPKQIDII